LGYDIEEVMGDDKIGNWNKFFVKKLKARSPFGSLIWKQFFVSKTGNRVSKQKACVWQLVFKTNRMKTYLG
jgi:hypothetical protein